MIQDAQQDLNKLDKRREELTIFKRSHWKEIKDINKVKRAIKKYINELEDYMEDMQDYKKEMKRYYENCDCMV